MTKKRMSWLKGVVLFVCAALIFLIALAAFSNRNSQQEQLVHQIVLDLKMENEWSYEKHGDYPIGKLTVDVFKGRPELKTEEEFIEYMKLTCPDWIHLGRFSDMQYFEPPLYEGRTIVMIGFASGKYTNDNKSKLEVERVMRSQSIWDRIRAALPF